MSNETTITKVTIFHDSEGIWYYAVWLANNEHDHNGEIDDAECETDAIAWVKSKWPSAKVVTESPIV